MTDYERTIVRDQQVVDPAHPSTADPAVASSVRTTEREVVPAGPSGASVASRIVTSPSACSRPR